MPGTDSEAVVILGADDEITGPATQAIASLRQLDTVINDTTISTDEEAAAMGRASGAANAYGAAVNNTIIPHRLAHQALALVVSQLGALAGASKEAEAAFRVLETALLQVAVFGDAVSPAFLAIVVAATAFTSALAYLSSEHKKENEEFD